MNEIWENWRFFIRIVDDFYFDKFTKQIWEKQEIFRPLGFDHSSLGFRFLTKFWSCTILWNKSCLKSCNLDSVKTLRHFGNFLLRHFGHWDILIICHRCIKTRCKKNSLGYNTDMNCKTLKIHWYQTIKQPHNLS